MRRRPQFDDSERVVRDPAAARKRTMDRAVRLLAAKPRSVGELRRRLLEKRWTDAEIVDAVLAKLEEYKYLDDGQYARELAAGKLRQKPQGRRRLEQTLAQKELDRRIVESAVNAAFEATPESDLIDRAIEKRLRIKGAPQTREETKKFYDHLMRLGFGYGLIREKLAALPADLDDE
jgi:regulatory protein